MLELIEQELIITTDKIGQLEQVIKDLQENEETATRVALTFPSKTISINNYTDSDYADLEAVFIKSIQSDIAKLKPLKEKLTKEFQKLKTESDKAEAEKLEMEEKKAQEREKEQREFELEKIRVAEEAKQRVIQESNKVLKD